jgi:hypothetical protein
VALKVKAARSARTPKPGGIVMRFFTLADLGCEEVYFTLKAREDARPPTVEDDDWDSPNFLKADDRHSRERSP